MSTFRFSFVTESIQTIGTFFLSQTLNNTGKLSFFLLVEMITKVN